MQVSVEAPSHLERRVTVIVPVTKLEEAYDQRIANLVKTAKIKGFRPGKIPVDFIKQRYGETARKEALSELIQSSFYAAIQQEKLNPVSTPTVEPRAVAPGQPIEFVATFEVMPEIAQVAYELPQIEKQVATIQDSDVEQVINQLREQYVTWQAADRPAELKDQVILDFQGSIDGQVFNGGEAHDFPLVLGSKKMIPGFEEGLLGIKAGEERVLHVDFPANYFAKEFAGKAAEFKVKALKVSAPQYPTVDNAFITKMGVKSGELADLQQEIRKNLERELKRVVKLKLKKQVFDRLLEQNFLEIPKGLIEREAKRIHDELHPHHAGAHDHGHSEEEMAGFNTAAKQQVALGLLVAKLLKDLSVTIDQERVAAQVAELATIYEKPEEVMAWYAKDAKARRELEMQVLEEQLLEKLLENTKIVEKQLSYQELVKGANQLT